MTLDYKQRDFRRAWLIPETNGFTCLSLQEKGVQATSRLWTVTKLPLESNLDLMFPDDSIQAEQDSQCNVLATTAKQEYGSWIMHE